MMLLKLLVIVLAIVHGGAAATSPTIEVRQPPVANDLE